MATEAWRTEPTTIKSTMNIFTKHTFIMALALTTCASIHAQSKALTLDVAQPGTLTTLLGEDASGVTSLTLTGKLNSTDIKCLRRLAGVDEYGNKVEGNSLTMIDMADADIVSGGQPYFYDYTTQDSIVGDFFFNDCTQLTSFRMPTSTKGIEWSAFAGCTSLSQMVVPDHVRYIDNEAFGRCTSLSTITLGDALTDIEGYAFIGCSSLESITLPESVSTIGDYAFAECTSLLSANVPSSVERLGMFAFSADEALTTVDIAEGVKHIGQNAFSDCTALEQITLPSSVDSIADGAFDGCTSLTSITLPKNLRCISESMLSNCSSLEHITLPESLTMIGEGAFCYDEALLEITIPDGVVEIGDDAFFDCESMTEASLGSGLTTIGESVFKFCESLQRINVSEANTTFASLDGALLSGDGATLLFLPPAHGEEYVVPAQVKHIGDNAAETNTMLRRVVIHDQVETIGHDAFLVCDSLRSVVIGSGVKEIGEDAFFSDDALEEIHCRIAQPLEIDDYVFWGPDMERCVLYVPTGSKQAYSEADVWKEFLHIEEEQTDALHPSTTTHADHITVYTINGVKVYEGPKDAFHPQAHGIYIINGGVTTL